MKKVYTDYTFYAESYLLGRDPKIPEKEFQYWEMHASSLIRRSTFENIDDLETIPDEVQMCCCEIAEKLYIADTAKEENGMILRSYSNDGDSGTYASSELSEDSVRRSTALIIRKWLSGTGLMYCGVN